MSCEGRQEAQEAQMTAGAETFAEQVDHSGFTLKGLTRLQWFLGPNDVDHVYGPFIPKTQGLLLSLMMQGFGEDVHVLNALTRVFNESGKMTEASEFTWTNEGEILNKECSSAMDENQRELVKAWTSGNVSLVAEVLLSTRRVFQTGIECLPVLDVLCGLAIPHRNAHDLSPIFPEGTPLPVEYMVCVFAALIAMGEALQGHQENKELPRHALIKRCFNDLLLATPTGCETTGYSATGARLYMICALLETAPDINLDFVTDEELQIPVKMLEHSNEHVTAPAIRLVGSFTNSDDDALDKLIRCGFVGSLPKLLKRRSRGGLLRKDALWALCNTVGGSPEQRAAVYEGKLDIEGLSFLSTKYIDVIRNEAVQLAELVVKEQCLRPECVFQMCQGVAELLQVWDDSKYGARHRNYLWMLLFHLFDFLSGTEIQTKHPVLFRDCINHWAKSGFVKGFTRFQNERQERQLPLWDDMQIFVEEHLPSLDDEIE